MPPPTYMHRLIGVSHLNAPPLPPPAFVPQAILESAARGKELGPVTLNLSFCEPFWKLLLGIPLNLMDLQVGGGDPEP